MTLAEQKTEQAQEQDEPNRTRCGVFASAEEVTAQALFDRAVVGVIKQGGPSWVGGNTGCAYRDPSGRKCAFGHLIHDDDYRTTMEGKNLYHSDLHDALPEAYRKHFALLDDLQSTHDSSVGIVGDWSGYLSSFARGARQLAERYRLTMPKELVDLLKEP